MCKDVFYFRISISCANPACSQKDELLTRQKTGFQPYWVKGVGGLAVAVVLVVGVKLCKNISEYTLQFKTKFTSKYKIKG